MKARGGRSARFNIRECNEMNLDELSKSIRAVSNDEVVVKLADLLLDRFGKKMIEQFCGSTKIAIHDLQLI